MKMTESTKQLLLYMAKCVTGVVIVFLLSQLLNFPDIGWAIISVILVISPDSREAVTLAVTRVKANLLGGVAGLLTLLMNLPEVFSISIAIVVTIALCHLFKVMAGSRSAIAAVIIILMHNSEAPTRHIWTIAIERIISVIAGCIIALIVTYIYHRKLHYPKAQKTSGDNEG